MRLFALLIPLLLCLTAPALATDTPPLSGDGHSQTEVHDAGEEDHEDHEASAEGVRALHAWVRATTARNGLLFVDIDNRSDKPVMLLGGDTEIADSVELVGFALKDGEPGYDLLPPVPVQPGKELMLAPNGLALRLNGLNRALIEGDSFDIELDFDFGHISMTAQVERTSATRHSHAGHQH